MVVESGALLVYSLAIHKTGSTPNDIRPHDLHLFHPISFIRSFRTCYAFPRPSQLAEPSMKSRRFFRTLGVCGLLSFLFVFVPAHSQQRPAVSAPQGISQPSAEEKILFESVNRERAAAGLQLLAWDSALAAAARQHALLMAQETLIAHQYPGESPLSERAAHAGAKFSMIAENIAVGADPEDIHDGWMHSPGHRKNILNPELAAVGIAAVRGRGGLCAVQDFSRPVADMTLQQQEERVISLLKQSGLRAAKATDDARKTCQMSGGYAGHTVLYFIRFEVVDLHELPEELLRRIKAQSYQTAAVGACRGDESAGFTRYRIAVLLE